MSAPHEVSSDPARKSAPARDRTDRPSISICVINYQGEDRIVSTLEAVEGACGKDDELVVVDSASTDRSRTLIAARFPRARVLALPHNGGPGFARNRGYEAAVHDLVVFVDNDVMVDATCINELLHALTASDDVVITMPRVRLAAAPELVQFEGANAHFLGLMSLRHAGRSATKTGGSPVEVGSMVSACFAIHRGRFGRRPPFDESFGFNYEDHDLGLRCRLAGHRLLAVPNADCLHGVGTEHLSVRGHGPAPPERVYHLIRGRWVILLKSFRLRTLLVLAPALALYEAVQLVFVIQQGYLRQWIRSVAWVAFNLGDVLRSRRGVQATRSLPDRALLVGGSIPFREELPSTSLQRLGIGFLDRVCTSYWGLARWAV